MGVSQATLEKEPNSGGPNPPLRVTEAQGQGSGCSVAVLAT